MLVGRGAWATGQLSLPEFLREHGIFPRGFSCCRPAPPFPAEQPRASLPGSQLSTTFVSGSGYTCPIRTQGARRARGSHQAAASPPATTRQMPARPPAPSPPWDLPTTLFPALSQRLIVKWEGPAAYTALAFISKGRTVS